VATAYEKFQKRLVLAAYFRDHFGAPRPGDPQAIPAFHEELREVKEGENPAGISYLARFLRAKSNVNVDEKALLRYDENVRRHTEKINAGRSEAITWRYFQHLAALMTEHYLSQLKNNPAELVSGINEFAEKWNAHRTYIKYPTVSREDLDKLAYWMATGSGKTLVMHLNYYQYRHYFPGEIDHHVLVTPNEGLTEQHMQALQKSGIACVYYDRLRSGGFAARPEAVKVLEISKLALEKTGEGMRVGVDAFEGQNLVFVDEGHKGASSEAGTWRTLREQLAGPEGFTFEYSATFGQAVGGSTPASVEEEYGRSILIDYSYQRFYEDGYGKDYQILNLSDEASARLETSSDPNAELSRARKHYLLANLLAFYEQQYAFSRNEDELRDTYHLKAPLLTFVGHSVTGGRTVSDLGTADERSVTDIQRLVRFLHLVLRNEGDWVPAAIDEILVGDPALMIDGRDLFEGRFELLKEQGLTGQAVLDGMRESIFHASGDTELHLVSLGADGEIGLRAGNATGDRFFGVIDVGNDRGFLKLTQQDLPDITVSESDFEGSLFKRINERGSQVNVLLGAKKFIEGWSSWRVSTMGLMNIGRGEGPQIIQLFGRGVRLKGKGRSLKRSSELPEAGPHPPHLDALETLHVFGVRAKYMDQFRKYLEQEGIDTEERQRIRFKTHLRDPFPEGDDLQTIEQSTSESYEEAEHLTLTLDNGTHPVVDLTPQVEALTSTENESEALPSAGEDEQPRTIAPALVPLLDWPRLYRAAWRYRTGAGYTNLTFDEHVLRRLIAEEHYTLRCPASMIECQSYGELGRIESIVLRVLRTYITDFYTRRKKTWEQARLRYTDLTSDDDNLVGIVEARVKRSKEQFRKALMERLQKVEGEGEEELLHEGDDTFYAEEKGEPPRLVFDPHLYQPLVIQHESHEPTVKYSPPGLNEGEDQFVQDLRKGLSSPSDVEDIKADYSLYLLRNQTRGKGVGFQMEGDNGRFFPDFILWLVGEDHQHILFIDPKGMNVGTGNIDADPKVRFCQSIGTIEASLRETTEGSNVHLDAFIVSTTDFATVRDKQIARDEQPSNARRWFNERKVYFQDRPGYVAKMLRAAN
jgi:hypothetical protein